MYAKSAAFYDALYRFKHYAAESERLHHLIEAHRRGDGAALLDVGCGTGKHLVHLQTWYQVEGLDVEPELLTVARGRLPDVPFHVGDMVDFTLMAADGRLRQFDALTCLFGAIGHVLTLTRLQQAIQTMARHVRPGGVLILEAWLHPHQFEANVSKAHFVIDGELKICRMNLSRIEPDAENARSIYDFHYMVASNTTIDVFTEQHIYGLFTHAQYMAALGAVGKVVECDPEGFMGRSLYVVVKD